MPVSRRALTYIFIIGIVTIAIGAWLRSNRPPEEVTELPDGIKRKLRALEYMN